MSYEAVGKKVLLVIAHPNTGQSFNHQMAEQTEGILSSAGFRVKVVDLYKIGFTYVGGPADFTEITHQEWFDYPTEQKNAKEKKTFSPEVQEQIDNVLWA
eukprot:CAMPEP_0115024616 /NCGR_PEP_ID=MMETSP0216-20121206/33385_1 /TAXON_ID=223996 /ORGANISM="Protocruzia adherens, Strain Boccale" /LENGTH=99 /DNA_ID=CAMNT_0002398791 /DNA_START=64 /DNA_END=359 /DNA_ORIENTATION=-